MDSIRQIKSCYKPSSTTEDCKLLKEDFFQMVWNWASQSPLLPTLSCSRQLLII